ncbi:MAG: hypothetical protein ACI8QT_001689 [Halioglobus sp.]|jgi:hypothetical protein
MWGKRWCGDAGAPVYSSIEAISSAKNVSIADINVFAVMATGSRPSPSESRFLDLTQYGIGPTGSQLIK